MIEPSRKTSLCPYCGTAPVNHTLTYIENFVTGNLDGSTTKLIRYAPGFIKSLADSIPIYLFKTLIAIGAGKFSSDIEQAASFRSRIIWEEAMQRGIPMEQIILFGKPLDQYRALIGNTYIYFESIPIPSRYLDMKKDWDNKRILKKEFSKHGIPIPQYKRIRFVRTQSFRHIFSSLPSPLIVKPEVGSRARHTVTNIRTLEEFKKAIRIANVISPYIIVEEHLEGYICRATLVDGVLAGFYRGSAPSVKGDGKKTIRELIMEKNTNRHERVSPICINDELESHIGRYGYAIDDSLPEGKIITLSHHVGRLFGGSTKEMLDELHPSFVPILEKAARIVGLAVAGFDCIIPDPILDAGSQRWGIIECNTLPFIDLHYYALEGKPRNIAGMIWDLWK